MNASKDICWLVGTFVIVVLLVALPRLLPERANPTLAAATAKAEKAGAITRGVRVEAQAQYRPDRSRAGNWYFSYHVRIANEGTVPVRLASRHWIVFDGNGKREDVQGPGVVGQQPRLEPGQAHEYDSACPLPTAHGTMEGTYHMVPDNGTEFDAEIPRFQLVGPSTQ